MLAVDTNVLVRVLVDDPGAFDQCRTAREAVSAAGKVFVSQAVQVETAWVLVRAYGLSKKRLQEVFGAIADHPAFEMQRRDVFLSALQTYLTCSADFADCLILTESALAGHELATFDRKLGKLAGAWLLAPS